MLPTLVMHTPYELLLTLARLLPRAREHGCKGAGRDLAVELAAAGVDGSGVCAHFGGCVLVMLFWVEVWKWGCGCLCRDKEGSVVQTVCVMDGQCVLG